MAAVGALPPTFQPRATRTMDAIIEMIGQLVAKDAAYAAEGHVLFNTQSFPDYGKLSGRPLDEMIAGARVEVAPYKQHPADFVLWKPSKPGEPEWPSPWGPGRPGWHIECTAMIEQSLGLPIDIHGGGIDLVFPHHENERAQGVCATDDHEYAAFWLHNGFLNFGDEKMSKSLGNVTLAHDLLNEVPGEAIRWALLSAHYRQPLAWTDDVLSQARSALDRLYGALHRSADLPADAGEPPHGFMIAISDDLNTPAAMAELFALAGEIERALNTASLAAAAKAKASLLAAGAVLGLLQTDPEAWFQGRADEGLKAKVEDLLEQRLAARAAKDWPTADRIRGELDALGVIVMDGPNGATWRMKD
jgi:cysteinyl-tRNA synthetase